MDGVKSADEASDKSDPVTSIGGLRTKFAVDFFGDDKIADLTGGELIVGNNLDNVGDLTVDGNMGDGGDQSVIDNMNDFAGCNTYVGGDNIAVGGDNDLNDEKPCDQMCNKCVSWMRTSKNLKRRVIRLQKQVKDLKIKNKELVIIFNYHRVCTCVVMHSVLYVIDKVKI